MNRHHRVMTRHQGNCSSAHRAHSLLLLLSCILWSLIAHALADDSIRLEDIRDFRAAEQALADGDHARFKALQQRLEEAPLAPYLQREWLEQRIATTPVTDLAPEVEAFLDRYANTGPGETLRWQWLQALEEAGAWTQWLQSYRENGSSARDCQYRRALIETGQAPRAFEDLEDLYLTGDSLPDACDPVLQAWADADGLPAELVWQRIDLALSRNARNLAAHQARLLPDEQRPLLESLLAVLAEPSLLIDRLPEDPLPRAIMITAAIETAAGRDPQLAVALHDQLGAHFAAADQSTKDLADARWPEQQLSAQAQTRIHLAIGFAFAETQDPEALTWLSRIEPKSANPAQHRRRLRAALHLEAWEQIRDWIDALPTDERQKARWHYWLGRAHAQTDQPERAEVAYRQAAGTRNLWGFLAAAQLDQPPALNHQTLEASPALLRELEQSPTLARIRALQVLGRQTEIAREWREWTRNLSKPQLLAAAHLADRLGLHNEAILTLAQAKAWDHLDLRFPTPLRPLLQASAQMTGLPEAWLYALIRRESAFDADVASGAGAIGLMQLLPETAREVARRSDLKPPSPMALIDPARNIELGSRYLDYLEARFNGHPILATAAYNAGPTAVERWLPATELPADLWIERVPYWETRRYLRAILTYWVIYENQLGQRVPEKLFTLPPIPARAP